MAQREFSFSGKTVTNVVGNGQPREEGLWLEAKEAEKFESWVKENLGVDGPLGESAYTAMEWYREWESERRQRIADEQRRHQDIAFEKGVSKEDDWIVRLHTMHYNGD